MSLLKQNNCCSSPLRLFYFSGIFGAALGLVRVSLLDTEVSYSLGIIDSLNKVSRFQYLGIFYLVLV